MELCKHLLESCPMNCQLLEALVALYLQTNQHDRARAVWLTAFEKNPQNAEVFYYTCKFFILQVKKKKKKSLLMFKYVFMFLKFLFIFRDVSGIGLSRKLFLVLLVFANCVRYSYSLCYIYHVHNSTIRLIKLVCNFIYSCFLYYAKNSLRI